MHVVKSWLQTSCVVLMGPMLTPQQPHSFYTGYNNSLNSKVVALYMQPAWYYESLRNSRKISSLLEMENKSGPVRINVGTVETAIYLLCSKTAIHLLCSKTAIHLLCSKTEGGR